MQHVLNILTFELTGEGELRAEFKAYHGRGLNSTVDLYKVMIMMRVYLRVTIII